MFNNFRKIYLLIESNYRKRLFMLTFLLLIGMILEVFGLGIIFPLIILLIEPGSYSDNLILFELRKYFSNFSNESFAIVFMLMIVFFYLAKTGYLLFLTYKQNYFLSNFTSDLSIKLFRSYMEQPFNFHLNRNVSDLIKNIQVEISILSSYLLSLITIIIEGGIIFSVIITLIYIEPIGAISIGLFFGILSIIFFQFTKSRLSAWGLKRQEIDSNLTKTTLEGLGGIKDLIVLGREYYFIDKFHKSSLNKAKILTNNGTLSQMPRFFLELITIAGLILFIITLLLTGKDSKSLVSIIGVFIAATFRAIPSITRILASFQNFKFNYPSVEIIFNEIQSLKIINAANDTFPSFNFKSNIKFKNVSFKYENSNIILKDINLNIKRGESIGIIGESGSGKSTLVNLLIGLIKPSDGVIEIDGVNSSKIINSWKNSIGYVSQSIFLTDDSIKNNIAFGIPESKINDYRILEVIEQVQLKNYISSIKYGLNSKVGERGIQLSGGQLQRIGIARALYHNPEILILDEATSSLDIETENEVLESMKKIKGEKTIIMIAHRISTLKDCDVVYKIENGKIYETKILK